MCKVVLIDTSVEIEIDLISQSCTTLFLPFESGQSNINMSEQAPDSNRF